MSASSRIRLTIIGAGPAYTDRRGAAGASYLLEGDGPGVGRLLLDLGQGAFANLAATVEPSAIAAILVSHLHPDHFIDLVPLRHYLRFQLHPSRRVAVFGPDALRERLDAVNGEAGFAAAALDIAPIAALPDSVGPFRVSAHPVAHAASGSYAYRVSTGDGAGLVYTGDCGRADDLIPIVRPGDVLLSEVSFGPGPVDPGAMHLDAHDVARVARATGASRVLLTHLQMGFDRAETIAVARAGYDGPVQLVTEGDCFEI